MLLSPGHSPRHLLSPASSPIVASDFAVCPSSPSLLTPKNHAKLPVVLDEDTYVAAIEKIIERDFFPDISKLHDRLDWLEALKTGDPVRIRDAQLMIIERRGKKVRTLDSGGSTRRTQTPCSTFSGNFTPFDDFDNEKSTLLDKNLLGDGENGGKGTGVDDSMRLDEFFRRFTSEDNYSFCKIIEKVNRKRKERFGYLLEGEKEVVNLVKDDDDDKRDRVTDGYGTSDQPPSTLDGWKYTAKNLLMYHPSDRGEVPLTDEEREIRLKSLTKEIKFGNTRFHGKMLDLKPKDDGGVDVLYTPIVGGTPVPTSSRDVDNAAKRYDLEELRKTPNPFYMESEKKAENGYNFVRTPSPAPGVGESPFVTWGEIEGTPLRLEPEDTPIDIGGCGNGPHFKIQNLPLRDVKAHSMSREASRKLKERSKMFQKPPLPSPVRSGSASPHLRTLSPAAQKFMRIAFSKSSSSVDETLRASYRGASPGFGTPNGGRSTSRLGRDRSIISRSPP